MVMRQKRTKMAGESISRGHIADKQRKLQSLSNYWYSDAFAKPTCTSRSHLAMLLTNCNVLHKFVRIALSNIEQGNGAGVPTTSVKDCLNRVMRYGISEINLFMLHYTFLAVASTQCL